MSSAHHQGLEHVWWLGGAPCAGKTSIAGVLAERFGLQVYHIDEAFPRHREGFTPQQQPILYKWTHRTWDELWMEPPDVLLREAIAGYGEHFQLIAGDLLAMPGGGPLLAEGTALLPDCVASWLSTPQQAIWLLPRPTFQSQHHLQRGPWVQDILDQCRDPQQALANWMARDAAFGQWVAERVEALGLELLWVDGGHTIEENAQLVAAHFELQSQRH